MDIAWEIAPPAAWRAEALMLFTFGRDNDAPEEPYSGLARAMELAAPWLAVHRGFADFEAGKGETVVLYAPGTEACSALRVVLAGLGPRRKFDAAALRSAAGAALAACRSLRVERAALPAAVAQGLPLEELAALEEILCAGMLGLYLYEPFKSEKDKKAGFPRELALWSEQDPPAGAHEALKRARSAAAGVRLARDLVNAPPNVCDADYLAQAARDMAAAHGLEVEVLDKGTVREMGMGAFSAVAQGSAGPANLIVLKTPAAAKPGAKPLVVVGKGVTFDTGGISLKPASSMNGMKGDMAGAAAVLGLFQALGDMGADLPVVGVMPCTDNMPGGRAFRPEDVITTLSGKTVEITNTDAEGRLLLCDALTFAQRFSPSLLVDLATLTGACVVALGPKVAGVFGNREERVAQLRALGEAVGDRFWPLPLWDMYFENLKSGVADMQNAGPREGGAVNAALFLKQFVAEDVDWLHLDIAGPAYEDKKSGSTGGGTGFGVRTLLALALSLDKESGAQLPVCARPGVSG